MVDRIGQKLGNYTLVQLIGKGGFADVYRAEHIYLKTQVAVKVLQTRLSTREDMNGFLREAQLIARLSHPHIVRVLDFGLDGDIPFLVMDYAPGGTLRQHHPRGTTLPLALVISYVKQLADALHYAHDEKVIHRDLKPENVLFGRRHEVVLSDFGIALISQSSRYQGTQEVAGTVAYMAPEQIQGKARPASDQYALGIAVYEWISGDRPFHGSFTEVCTQHLFAPVPPLSEKVPGILPQVEQVITIALAKDPKQRWASIQAFARALEQASQSAEPTVLTPPSSPASVTAQPKLQAQTEEMPASIQLDATPTPATPPTVETPASSPVPQAATTTPSSPTPHTVETPASSLAPQEEPPTPHPEAPAHVASANNPWSIGGQRMGAMIIGILLFSIADYILDLLFVGASNNASAPQYQAFLLFGVISFTLLNVALGFSLIIPAFFAARFGPWVGCASAAFGSILGDALSSTLSASFNPWYGHITYAIFGFIAGLAFIRTRGYYRTRSNLLSLIIIDIVGLAVSLAWQSIGDTSFNPPVPFTNFYLPMALVFCLPGLLLLTGLLVASTKSKPLPNDSKL